MEKNKLSIDEMIEALKNKISDNNKKIQTLKNTNKKLQADLENLELKKENEELKKKLESL